MQSLMPQVPFTVVPTALPGSKTAQLVWSFEIAAAAVTNPESLHIILHSTRSHNCSPTVSKNLVYLHFHDGVLCWVL